MTDSHFDVEALVEKIRKGDRDAESELIARYTRGVRIIVRRTVRDRGAVDDLCQETFRVAVEKIRNGDVREPSRLSGFVCAVARNMALEHVRRSGREEPLAAFDAADPGPTPLDRLMARERAKIARRVLAEMGTERDRTILWRFYVADDPKADICRELGLSSLHFNRVLFRARERFRRLYQELLAKRSRRL